MKKKILPTSFRLPSEYLEMIDSIEVEYGVSKVEAVKRAIKNLYGLCSAKSTTKALQTTRFDDFIYPYYVHAIVTRAQGIDKNAVNNISLGKVKENFSLPSPKTETREENPNSYYLDEKGNEIPTGGGQDDEAAKAAMAAHKAAYEKRQKLIEEKKNA